MHTSIKLSQNIGTVLRYHERKVKQNQGECLYAGNMLKEAPELTPKEKLFYLERVQGLNDRVRRKTLHIFLSWHRDDVLDDNKMRSIAKEYIQEMGLGKQPYLVYRHWDTPHAHAHIVTTNIRPDGTRIELWRAQRLQSMQLSRQLEMKYGLYRAGARVPDAEWARQNPAQKVVYGVTPLKPTINAVLERVLPVYKYTTLEELNAVLRSYNIRASLGREGSFTRRNNGLLYFPLKDSGAREDVYIRSSDLRSKPTLSRLHELFTGNMREHMQYRERLTTTIDWIFRSQRVSPETFRQALLKEKVRTFEDREGPDRRIFYIDELAKTVYEGERLGRQYSAEGIEDRCIPEETWRREQSLKQEQKQTLRQRPRMDLY